ncbi:hypothetical protein [Terracoccus luteus]|uniref:Small secreted protein n=1 Tax=Terracoccus luteus TaxID=53356 RepID=A0A839Q2R3_9MICO|nr:hypothetical protein [Terracoccus luteus]MBB2987402.1 hypothetical protein [Terracoccus luteus]MCP2173053.1 hypothetical protein [Terracoccus luteus]
MTFSRRLARPAALLLVAGVPLLAACGGDASTPSTGAGGAMSSSSMASMTPSSTMAEPSSSEPSMATSSETGTASAKDAPYCSALKTAEKEISNLTQGSPTPDVLKKFVTAVKKVEDQAPSDVKGAWTDFRELIQKAADGDAAALKEGGAQVSALGDTVSADAKKRCGFTF